MGAARSTRLFASSPVADAFFFGFSFDAGAFAGDFSGRAFFRGWHTSSASTSAGAGGAGR